MKKEKIVAGEAAISRITTTSAKAVSLLGEQGEFVEPGGPERLEELLQWTELFMIGTVEPLLPIATDGHKTRIAQERQVLRDAGVAQIEAFDEFADRELVAPNLAENLLAARLGDELEDVHATYFIGR